MLSFSAMFLHEGAKLLQCPHQLTSEISDSGQSQKIQNYLCICIKLRNFDDLKKKVYTYK